MDSPRLLKMIAYFLNRLKGQRLVRRGECKMTFATTSIDPKIRHPKAQFLDSTEVRKG